MPRRRTRRNRGVLLLETSALFVVTGAVVYMASLRCCEAFPKANLYRRSNGFEHSLVPPSTTIRLYNSPGFLDDENKDVDRFDDETEHTIRQPVSVNEMRRRNFLFAATAAIAFLPTQSVYASQDVMVTNKSLEDLQFAHGSWDPGRQTTTKEKSVEIDDQNLVASTENTNAVVSTQSIAPVRVDACFTTYLTRFLINYDEGVNAWWRQLQVSYSLLANEQRQNRLGRDFGSLAASIQEAVQVYIQKSASTRQGYEQLFDRFASTYDATTNDEVRRQLCLLAATLPVDQQPKETIKKIISTKTNTKVSQKLDSSSLALMMNENLSNLLPREYSAVVSSSDGVINISPHVSLYQVGIGEEFGQAATATTFGPLALTALKRELPRYTFDIYALFGISGATGKSK